MQGTAKRNLLGGDCMDVNIAIMNSLISIIWKHTTKHLAMHVRPGRLQLIPITYLSISVSSFTYTSIHKYFYVSGIDFDYHVVYG